MKKVLVLPMMFCLILLMSMAFPVGGAYATFAGKFGGDINSKELTSTTQIGIDGCAAGSRILRYTLVIQTSEVRMEFDGDSSELTRDMLKELLKLKRGDSFVFKNMKAQLPAGGKVDVISKEFRIV